MRKNSKTSKEMSYEEQAEEILALARKGGVEQNFFFATTFERYLTQIKILDTLKKVIEDEGTLVTKEYVKGRGNVYTHPAIKEYNSTSVSANQTVSALLKIITTLRKNSDDSDELLDFIGIK